MSDEHAVNEGETGTDEEQAAESDAKTLEVFQDNTAEGEEEQWSWHAQAGNNRVVAEGHGFNTRENALRAAEDAFPDLSATVTTVVNENEPTEVGPDDEDSYQQVAEEPELVNDDPDQTEGENA